MSGQGPSEVEFWLNVSLTYPVARVARRGAWEGSKSSEWKGYGWADETAREVGEHGSGRLEMTDAPETGLHVGGGTWRKWGGNRNDRGT